MEVSCHYKTRLEFHVKDLDAYITVDKRNFKITQLWAKDTSEPMSYVSYEKTHGKCGKSLYLFDDMIMCKNCNEIIDLHENEMDLFRQRIQNKKLI